ncbi:MAG: hypothetical protein IJV31_07715 [Clostridia bacterium]|nr:hypothetical protein [Clostridia bacterium]
MNDSSKTETKETNDAKTRPRVVSFTYKRNLEGEEKIVQIPIEAYEKMDKTQITQEMQGFPEYVLDNGWNVSIDGEAMIIENDRLRFSQSGNSYIIVVVKGEKTESLTLYMTRQGIDRGLKVKVETSAGMGFDINNGPYIENEPIKMLDENEFLTTIKRARMNVSYMEVYSDVLAAYELLKPLRKHGIKVVNYSILKQIIENEDYLQGLSKEEIELLKNSDRLNSNLTRLKAIGRAVDNANKNLKRARKNLEYQRLAEQRCKEELYGDVL